MSGKIYRYMHVSRSTIPLTNHSCQVWWSIYNSNINVKISPTKIWSAWGTSYARKWTRPFVQRYKAKCVLRQNSTKSIKLFRFSTFYVFLDFWHKSKKRLIKKQCKNILKKCKQTNTNFQIKLASQQKAHNQAKSQNIGSINAWTCCNAYAWIPFFTHTSLAFGVISLAD